MRYTITCNLIQPEGWISPVLWPPLERHWKVDRHIKFGVWNSFDVDWRSCLRQMSVCFKRYVCLCLCLSVCLSVWVCLIFVYLNTCMSISHFVYLNVHKSLYLVVCILTLSLSVCFCIYLYGYLSFCISFFLFIWLSV